MKKNLLRLSLLLLAVLSLCGCSKGNGEGKRFVYPIDADPVYLDPQIVDDRGGRCIVANCFEGLVRYGSGGELLPGVAKSHSVSADGRVYTFKLREDARWFVSSATKEYLGEDYLKSLKTQVTAEDFVFALTRALTPETGSVYAQSLLGIKNASAVLSGKVAPSQLGVKAVDKHTLVITLEAPDDDFLGILTTPVCMPCNKQFFERTGGRYGITAKQLLYNGPFYISRWLDDTSITVKRNADYLGESKVTADSVYFSMNNEKETRLRKLLEGVYDVTPLTEDLAASAAERSDITLQDFGNGIKGLLFNCRDEVVGNVHVRRALAQALEVRAAFSEPSLPGGIVPDCCTAAGKSYRQLAGNLKMTAVNKKEAQRNRDTALAQLKTEELEISVLCSMEDELAVRRAMQSWQAVFGVALAVKVDPVDRDTLSERVKAGDFQLAYGTVKSVSSRAMEFLRGFTSDSTDSITGFKSQRYDSLVAAASCATDSEKRLSLMKQAEQLLIDDGVVIPVCSSSDYIACSGKVTGLVYDPSGELVYFSEGLNFNK